MYRLARPSLTYRLLRPAISAPTRLYSSLPLRTTAPKTDATPYRLSHLLAVALATTAATGYSAYTFAHAESPVVASVQVVEPSPASKQTTQRSAENVLSEIEPESQDLVNWSGTHSVTTAKYYQPETLEQLKDIVRHAHNTHQKLRPVGSALSPNGIPFSSGGMVNLINMDEILSIDRKTNRVTVQAGARVSQVVDALRPHGLTLQNFASITEQQIGGFTQIGAHGTGMTIPPVDEQVVAMRLITPAAGEVVLSADDDDPSLFQLARTSLGLLGVVADVTLQCVPAHKLVERTTLVSRHEIAKSHRELMEKNRHLRYMWIPHTDAVIVVTCNPAKDSDVPEPPSLSMKERLEHVCELLLSHPRCKLTKERVHELEFTALRDELLALDPLNVDWIRKVNEAEATFWRLSQGTRIDWSDRILQFDCGGQQWVNEVAFPVPKGIKGNPDVEYVQSLLDLIERQKIAAPSPIEQRWSAPSSSPLSPASEKPGLDLAEFYSWVGIIMYLPDATEDAKVRADITDAFRKYKMQCEEHLWPEVRAVEHWAKIEKPSSDRETALLQQRTSQKYPVEAFKAICSILDPHGILRNDLTDTIFSVSKSDTSTSK